METVKETPADSQMQVASRRDHRLANLHQPRQTPTDHRALLIRIVAGYIILLSGFAQPLLVLTYLRVRVYKDTALNAPSRLYRMTTNFRVDQKLFINLTFGFIVSTVIGTLSHEGGHLLVGWWLGYTDSQLHYGSANPGHSPVTDSLAHYRQTYQRQLESTGYFPQRTRLDYLVKLVKNERLYTGWGGPLQTMVTGTIGCIALRVIKRGRKNIPVLSLADWIWVFVALFWLRQLANFTVMVGLLIVTGRYGHGDETYLSAQYGWPVWSINAITAGLSAFVLYYVIIKIIPPFQRFTFIMAGLVGGATGYVLWLKVLGPVVLP